MLSTTRDGYPASNCVDGDRNTPCVSNAENSPQLRIGYPCELGLSRVEVTNRVDNKDQILQFQMRALGPNRTEAPVNFTTTADSYTWQTGK